MNDEIINILIVEDNPGDFVLIRELLALSGLKINLQHADNMSGAVKLLRTDPTIALILLDLSLPDSSGIETFERMSTESGPTPVIVLSGLLDAEVAVETVKKGAQDYVLKGHIDEHTLHRTIRYAFERKNNLDKIKKSEAQYKLLFEHNPIPMWSFDPKTFQILMVNEAAIQRYGYLREEFLEMSVKDLVTPDDWQRLISHPDIVNNSLTIGNIGEWQHICRDGSTVWDEVIIHSIELNGKIARLVAAHDVTERYHARERLRKSEQMYRSMAQNFPNGTVTFLDRELKFLFIEGKELKKLGLRSEDIIGRQYMDMVDGADDKYRAEEELQKALGGENVLFDITFRGNDYFVSAVPLTDGDGQLERILVVTQNITQRKIDDAHRRLLESVITHARDAVLITRAEPITGDGPEIVYVNNAFTQMTGYTPAEVIGKTPRLLQGAKTSREELDKVHYALAHWETVEAEVINYKKNGEEFWMNFSIFPLADETGWYTHWIAIQRDVTQRKQSEEQQNILTAELTVKNKDLQQFSFIASHNLRAPLANLVALLRILDKEDLNGEHSRGIIEKFEQSTLQLDQTLDDLIDIITIQKNVNIPQEPVNIEEVYSHVTGSIHKLIDEASATLKTDFDTITFNSNKVYLESIMLNLITNAIKYRDPMRPLTINIASRVDGGYVVLDFADNGLGIDLKRYGDRIFGLYQKFHSNDNSRGMGLFIVNSQVRAMGGKIEVQSEVNKGTHFQVYLKQN